MDDASRWRGGGRALHRIGKAVAGRIEASNVTVQARGKQVWEVVAAATAVVGTVMTLDRRRSGDRTAGRVKVHAAHGRVQLVRIHVVRKVVHEPEHGSVNDRD